MTPSTLALARRVRALLAEPERWTQGWAARTRRGHRCSASSHGAVKWTVLGAMWKLQRGPAEWFEMRAEIGRLTERDAEYFGDWHDSPETTHADVLALLDRVIAEGERCHERAAVD